MGLNINDFTTNIDTYGLQSTNKFTVDMTVPTILADGLITGPANPIITTFLNKSTGMIQYRAESVTLPEVGTLNAETTPYGYGRKIKQAFNAIFTDCKIEFLADAEGFMEAYFDLWMNSIFNYADSSLNAVTPTFFANYRDDIKSTINIYKYDDFGELINVYTLVNAIPTAFAPGQLSWLQQNQKMKFIVNFTYTGYAID
jgi:hypothetical protein